MKTTIITYNNLILYSLLEDPENVILYYTIFIYVGLQHGIPPSSAAAGLLAGLPPATSAAFVAAHMARLPLPLSHHDLHHKREEEHAKPLIAPPGPSSEERHVST